MIVQKFFAWADQAPPEKRAAASAALARSYLAQDRIDFDRSAAEVALTILLDDPSALVRRALAEVFAQADEAPHHVILALAADRSDISAIVLEHSPLLSDEELIDCAAIGDAIAQTAIARRRHISPGVAAAVAEIGAREAVFALASNRDACVPDFALRRIFERWGSDGEVREALLQNEGLTADLRVDIAGRTATALANFVTSCAWMSSERASRTTQEAMERATVAIAADSEQSARPLAAHLRASGQLTVALLLRSLLSGERTLFAAALAELSGLPHDRVGGHVRRWSGAGFAALYEKAGLPAALRPAFQAALSAQDELLDHGSYEEDAGPRLSRRLIERVLTSCEAIENVGAGSVVALFRRLACEAAREDARERSRAWTQPSRALPPPSSPQIDLAALEAELMAA